MIIPVRYRVLGPLEAEGDEGIVALGGPKQRLVLAVLLIQPRQVVSDDRLVDELWPDEPPDGARHAIQTYVSELRRALTDEILREGRGYRLAVDAALVDARRFETLVAAGRQRLRDAPASAATLLREGLALWHGEPFGGVAESPLLQSEIQRLTEMRLTTVEERIAAELEAGRHVQVVPELASLTREHPFRERLHALHMLALYRSDRQADALQAYHRARRWLVEEMGIDPSGELQTLERRILEQDPALAPPPSVSGTGTSDDEPTAIRGFELRERVAEDDVRVTWHAYQPSVGREVAITAVRGAVVQERGFMRAFDPRARQVAGLEHANVAPILDWWRDPTGAFVVTPWFERGNLRRAVQGTPASVARMLSLVEQIGSALQAAHRAGIVHGALDTSAIVLDARDAPLVVGFVPAQDLLPDGASSPALAPEMRRGAPPTEQSDVWALGRVAIELLAGGILSAGSPAGTLAHLRTDLRPELLDALDRATARRPGERQERVGELLRELRRAAGSDVAPSPADDVAAAPLRNPYKGLLAFSESDESDFYGRSALRDRLVRAVAERQFVALAGPSGSGKSSLVRAGLFPVLRAADVSGDRSEGGWLVAELFPGPYPFEELSAVLQGAGVDVGDGVLDGVTLASAVAGSMRDGARLLLFVDQFEELWTLTEDADARHRFVAALLDAVMVPGSPLRVLVALRTDFLDRAIEAQPLGDAMREGLVLVTPPNGEELAEAIVEPARRVGVEFEAGLVDAIVRDVRGQPGALPLLQHALAELFARRIGRRIGAAAYRESGGVASALGRRAEEVYRGLPPPATDVARQVFLRLVTVDEEHDDARRRVLRTELGSLGADPRLVDEVLQTFGAHRLLSFDRDAHTRGPTVEVAHEALFREWPRLRGWIESRRDDLLRHRRLRAATSDWLETARSPDYLHSGQRLAEAELWRDETDLILTRQEREFLALSRAREEQATAGRRRLRRIAVAGAAVAASVALGLAGFAWTQMGRAEAGEALGVARALAIQSRAQQQVDQDLALLLAMRAVEMSRAATPDREPIPDAVQALRSALDAHRTVVSADVGGFFVAFGADGTLFSAGPPRFQPAVWSEVTGEVLRELDTGGKVAIGQAVSADGRFAVETYGTEPARVWDVRSGDVVADVGESSRVRWHPALSGDGSLLAMDSLDEAAGRWELTVRELPSGRVLHTEPINASSGLAFAPNGAWLAVADSPPGVVRVLDTGTWKAREFGVPIEEPPGIESIAFSADSTHLAVYAYEPSRVQIYDLAGGELLGRIVVGSQPDRVCFSADGGWVVASAADELVHVWEVESGAPVATLPGSDHLGGLACAPDGPRVAVSGPGGTGRVYDLAMTSSDAGFPTDAPSEGSWGSDGSLLVGHDGGILRRYATKGTLLAETSALHAGSEPWTLRSPDGAHVAAELMDDGEPRVGLLDAVTLEVTQLFDGPGFPLAFSADGSLLLAGSQEDGAVLYDVPSGALVARLVSPASGGGFPVPDGIFLPDQRHVVLEGDGGREAWIFEVSGGTHVGTLCATDAGNSVTLDPLGETLYIGDRPGYVESWRVDGMLEAAAEVGATCGETSAEANPAWTGRWEASVPRRLEISPDGEWLTGTSGFDGNFGVWEIGSHRPILQGHQAGMVSMIGFSPDGRQVAITVFDESGGQHGVHIYALDTGELMEQARRRLTREMTDAECQEYLKQEGC